MGSDFGNPTVLTRLLLEEYVHEVISHLLLSDDDLLTAIYDKVPPLIVFTFTQVDSFLAVLIMKDAEVRSDHNGDSTKGDLLINLIIGDPFTPITLIYLHRLLPDIHIQLTLISQITDTGLVR